MKKEVDLFETLKSIIRPMENSVYINGLNIQCQKCFCWVSKRLYPKILEDGLCPGCRNNERM